jgi:hypothetical protein
VIAYKCPECGEVMVFEDRMAGEEEICKACGDIFIIPDEAPAETKVESPRCSAPQQQFPMRKYNVIVRSRTHKERSREDARIHGNGVVNVVDNKVNIEITQHFFGYAVLLGLVTFCVMFLLAGFLLRGSGMKIILPGWIFIAIAYYYLLVKKHVFSVVLDKDNVLFDSNSQVVFFRIKNKKWVATKCREHPKTFFQDITRAGETHGTATNLGDFNASI